MMKTDVRRVSGTLLVLALTLALLASIAWADGETGTVVVGSSNPLLQVKGTVGGTAKTVWAGTLYLQITDGPRVNTFCTDLLHSISNGDKVVASSEEMDCRVRWLLLHYPPRADAADYQNDTAPGRLPDVKKEMAARQAAVWYFSDGFVLLNESPTPPDVYNRTQEIIAAVQALADACAPDAPNIAISPSNAALAVGEEAPFTLQVTRGGHPVAGQTVTLTVSLGTVTPSVVTTDENGEATFTLTSAVAGTSSITATTRMPLPVGTIFVGVNPNKQKLVLGQFTEGPVAATASATWVNGSSLIATVFNDLNMDGLPQDGERGQSGWTVTVIGKGSKTTNTTGNATWSLTPGTYTVVLTQQSGWLATTPITQTVALAPGDVVQVLFGQIKLPVVKVYVFHDTDLSGSLTDGDLPLSGWTVGLYRADGSQAAGWNRATDDSGWVYFSNDPSRNPPDLIPGAYYVQETPPDGWYATSGISRSFTLISGEVHEEYLGNFPPAPAVSLIVDASPALIHSGDSVTYTYQVVNTGNTYLRNIRVTDDRYDSICTIPDLAPGEEMTCRFTTPVADSVTNTGTAIGTPTLADGTPIAGWPDVSDSDDAFVRVLHPAVTVTASGPALAHEGDTLTYAVTVANTGDAGLTVSVPLPDGTTWTGMLAAGESATFTATGPVSGDPTVVTFTATGTDALGGEVSAQATVSTDILHPALEVRAAAPIATVYPGTVVTLTYTVTNTGDVPLSDVVLWWDNGTPDDPDDDWILCTVEYLEVGQAVQCQVPVAPEQETTYTASATGTDPLGGQAEDSAGITIGIIPTEPGDTDGDGTPDYLDADSDGDGIPDWMEAGCTAPPTDNATCPAADRDSDSDGTPDYLDDDSDNDGVPDWMEAGCTEPPTNNQICPEAGRDSDGDGTPDYRDPDDDGDGISTANEYIADTDYFCENTSLDTDRDGTPNCRDNDVDGDGIPNYLDRDSDGDGTPDAQENYPSQNPPPFGHSGVPAWIDPVYRLYLPIVLRNR